MLGITNAIYHTIVFLFIKPANALSKYNKTKQQSQILDDNKQSKQTDHINPHK